MKVEKRNFGICKDMNYIYIIGGMNKEMSMRCCQKYDYKNDIWYEMRGMNE